MPALCHKLQPRPILLPTQYRGSQTNAWGACGNQGSTLIRLRRAKASCGWTWIVGTYVICSSASRHSGAYELTLRLHFDLRMSHHYPAQKRQYAWVWNEYVESAQSASTLIRPRALSTQQPHWKTRVLFDWLVIEFPIPCVLWSFSLVTVSSQTQARCSLYITFKPASSVAPPRGRADMLRELSL